MKNKNQAIKYILLLSSWLFISNIGLAQEEVYINEVVAGNFFGGGARAMAMGGAQIAACDDGTALIYNPAALGRVR